MPKFNPAELSERALLLAKEEKLSVAKLEEKIEIDRKTIYNWKYGKNTLSAKAVFQFANAFGVSADWLLGLTDDRNGGNPSIAAAPRQPSK